MSLACWLLSRLCITCGLVIVEPSGANFQAQQIRPRLAIGECKLTADVWCGTAQASKPWQCSVQPEISFPSKLLRSFNWIARLKSQKNPRFAYLPLLLRSHDSQFEFVIFSIHENVFLCKWPEWGSIKWKSGLSLSCWHGWHHLGMAEVVHCDSMLEENLTRSMVMWEVNSRAKGLKSPLRLCA